MQNQRTLTHIFSLPRNVCFHKAAFASGSRKQSFSPGDENLSGRKWRLSRSLLARCCEQLCIRKRCIGFIFAIQSLAKKDQMQLRKFMGRDGLTAISHQSASRELPGDSLENICGEKTKRIKSNNMSRFDQWFLRKKRQQKNCHLSGNLALL